jgi:ERCC4-type nuclease
VNAAVLKGRFWPQLGKLRAACAFPYLLVEGSDIARFRPVKGISTSSARALLKRFGSIAAVVRRAC